ncbi:hypothetical protein Ctha_1058 [Chloroherpeton thalassium ATCC 35110]|uniref:Uncharacterized protein n=1 Tax=Chloroherpeton thalassium (strain ATCC 35110 / GB-78) TaxID=517418 RepID=B3QXZ4_CHLT3|nr:hypothetical protein [Chloroherpeton thalassium]ACF13522.1 hypothetical protein Ctha_1058 [Chloroherpeton thalassium ATCC 35110]
MSDEQAENLGCLALIILFIAGLVGGKFLLEFIMVPDGADITIAIALYVLLWLELYAEGTKKRVIRFIATWAVMLFIAAVIGMSAKAMSTLYVLACLFYMIRKLFATTTPEPVITLEPNNQAEEALVRLKESQTGSAPFVPISLNVNEKESVDQQPRLEAPQPEPSNDEEKSTVPPNGIPSLTESSRLEQVRTERLDDVPSDENEPQHRPIANAPENKPPLQNMDISIRLLHAAMAYKGRITAAEAAAGLYIPYEEAQQELEELASQGACQVTVGERGILVYYFPEFEDDDHKKGVL